MGPASRRHRRTLPSFSCVKRPAFPSTLRCLEMAGSDMSNGRASSVTVRGRSANRVSMVRRVVSLNAENTALRHSSEDLTIWLSIIGGGLPSTGAPAYPPNMHPLLEKLRGGDRRSIGLANEVARQVLRAPALLRELFRGMLSSDPVIRMRAADAAEKVTAERPELLQRYKKRLLHEIASIDQQEVRWHVAQMIPRLELTPQERAVAVKILITYLALKSKIVRTVALQALASFAANDPALRRKVLEIVRDAAEKGSPAMQARGRKLLAQLRALAGAGLPQGK